MGENGKIGRQAMTAENGKKEVASLAKLAGWCIAISAISLTVGFLFLGIFHWAKPDSMIVVVFIVPFMMGFFLFSVGGGFLGACALLQIAVSPKKFKGIFRSLVAVLIAMGVFVAAVSNIKRFDARGKQSEARMNLQAIYEAYQVYHSSHGAYPGEPSIQIGDKTLNCLSATDWTPAGQLRYTYECMGTPAYWPGWNTGESPHPCVPPIASIATKDSFTIAACANIDNDPFIDEWTINDQGKLINVIDDITNKVYKPYKKRSLWNKLWN